MCGEGANEWHGSHPHYLVEKGQDTFIAVLPSYLQWEGMHLQGIEGEYAIDAGLTKPINIHYQLFKIDLFI